MKISLSLSLLSPDLLLSFMSTPENKIFSGLQVLATMERLEKVNSFQEFVQIFSQFGNEMVEFAHLTGDRQNVRIYRRLKFPSTRILFWCPSHSCLFRLTPWGRSDSPSRPNSSASSFVKHSITRFDQGSLFICIGYVLGT